ncbi:NAD(P)-binding domain-containing protein [Pseudonocardia sp. NPDC049154]|uniref:NAD(P)-binding domain-containing protein n=1 Tax=Pseudonocardia sp. NPDC049154 TaxID=3155501 RepID=UPI0033FA15DC
MSITDTPAHSTAARTDLLVIGAGPYACSAAALARDNGIDTHVVGRPMAFWREHMPAGMLLRSGPDWHLDAGGECTFEAYFEDQGLRPEECDPIPVGVFLDYTDWFRRNKGLDVDQRLVTALSATDGAFTASLDDGSTITAEKVLAAPGVRQFANLPAWHTEVPPSRRGHTSDIVSFDDLAGARVAIIGGRQSAYEWAALLCEHGAEQVDVVHRHAVPEFAKVSWAFVDAYIASTLAQRGWWRRLPAEQQQAIAATFWRVGRLTLESWLAPRLAPDVVTRHPYTEVTGVTVGAREIGLTLSDATVLATDHVIFASGYRADLARVPYLAGVVDQLSVTDGFPDLSEGFETSLTGLYVTGFASTRDFGPFYGFTAGCPSSARIAVAEMMR